MKCKYCGYEWEERVEIPKTCPRCKRYNYQDDLKGGNQEDEKETVEDTSG